MSEPFLSQTQEPVLIRRRGIDGAPLGMVAIEEIGTDDLEITAHPVQQGAEITDHAYLKPATLSMRALWGSQDQPLAEIYQALRDLQQSRLPFDVVTGKRIYSNMLMQGLGVTTDPATENILSVNFSLRQILLVQVTTTTVPPRAAQRSPGRTSGTTEAGQKSATPEADTRRRSALRALAGN